MKMRIIKKPSVKQQQQIQVHHQIQYQLPLSERRNKEN